MQEKLDRLRAQVRDHIARFGQCSFAKSELEKEGFEAWQVGAEDNWAIRDATLTVVFLPQKSPLIGDGNTIDRPKKKIGAKKKS